MAGRNKKMNGIGGRNKPKNNKPLPLELMKLYNCAVCGTINMGRLEALKHPCKGFRACFGMMGI